MRETHRDQIIETQIAISMMGENLKYKKCASNNEQRYKCASALQTDAFDQCR